VCHEDPQQSGFENVKNPTAKFIERLYTQYGGGVGEGVVMFPNRNTSVGGVQGLTILLIASIPHKNFLAFLPK